MLETLNKILDSFSTQKSIKLLQVLCIERRKTFVRGTSIYWAASVRMMNVGKLETILQIKTDLLDRLGQQGMMVMGCDFDLHLL